MIKNGSQLKRFMNTQECARDILEQLISLNHAPTTSTTRGSVFLESFGKLFSGMQTRRPTRDDCHSILLDITNNNARREALCSLRDDDAQAMVDYLNLVSLTSSSSRNLFTKMIGTTRSRYFHE